MTNRETIQQAADAYSTLQAGNFSRNDCSFCDTDFKAGADYVLQHPELFWEQLLNYDQWLRDNTILDGAPRRLYKPTGERKTDTQLASLYLEHLKQKQ
jgi:hypothetical protein